MGNSYTNQPGLLPTTKDDKYQALYQGLLNMGSNMGGFSSSPTGFMQQLGKGGAALGQGYQGAIAKTKQDQLQEMQAQSQQAQMEAQMMKIEQAKQAKLDDERQRKAGIDYQANMMGPQTAETQARYSADPFAAMTQDISTRASFDAASLEHQRRLEIEQAKDPAMDWALVNGKPQLMPKNAIMAQGLPKYERPRLKSPEELAQDVTVAEATAGSKPLTDAQAKSGTFALRMYGASDKLRKSSAGPDGKLGTPDDYVPSRADTFSFDLPGGNSMVSPEYQQYRQAQDDWLSANLRKESGAVIGVEEMVEERKKYFPQPGDGAKTIKQKATSRRTAEAAMKVSSGRAYNLMEEELGGNPYAGFEVVE